MSNFNAQNPILDNLLGEIESSKFKDTDVKKFLKKAPSVKDIEINERLQELKISLFNNNKNDDDDDDNNDDVDNNILPPQPPSPPPSPPP